MKKKKITALFMAVCVAASMAGCGGSGSDTGSTDDGGEAAAKIGIIFGTGGLGDKNFNDMAYDGITRAEEELGIEFDYAEPEAISDFVSYGRQFAETGEYDLLIGIGADMEEAMVEVAAEFPDQKITVVDSSSDLEEISSIQTEWSEQTFLAGVIAGLGTLSDMEYANDANVIGVILGQDQPGLREGVVGFTAGAKYVNPDVEVLEGVVGAFNDPGRAKEVALTMYNKEADFIQCIAGAGGLGIFSAAKETGAYAFGVGSNQNSEEPDYIPASSIRDVSSMVYNEVQKVIDGTWEPGLHISGMKEGAVDCVTEGSNVVLPEEIQTAVEEIKGQIQSGELTPCKTAEEMDQWVADNQYQS